MVLPSSLKSNFMAGIGGGERLITSSGAVERRPLKGTPEELHIKVIDYLKTVPRDRRITFNDVKDDLYIVIPKEDELKLIEILKNNVKLNIEALPNSDGDVDIVLRLKVRFEVQNEIEFLDLINQIGNGVIMKELIESNLASYPSICEDFERFVEGGDIIAIENKSQVIKSLIAYPRNKPFLTQLSGNVSICNNSDELKTSVDLRREVRRGDAIRVGDHQWFRIASSTGAIKEPKRAQAPLSVTSVDEMSSKNVYNKVFDSKIISLNSEFFTTDESPEYYGNAYRHGVSNDVRSLWNDTLVDFKNAIDGDESILHNECLRLKLVSLQGTSTKRIGGRLVKEKGNKRSKTAAACVSQHNPHLAGTELERKVLLFDQKIQSKGGK